MGFSTAFIPQEMAAIHDEVARRHEEGWRYVQMLAVNKDEGCDLIYSFMLDGQLDNLLIEDLPRESHLPSITDLYLEAFVCENEINDLFGIHFDGIAIDFMGNFYKLSTEKPMTIISPAQLAEREKMRRIAAAKAAKASKAAKEAAGEDSSSDAAAELEAKLAAMDPEKAAKVRAAMEAKKAKEAAQKGKGE